MEHIKVPVRTFPFLYLFESTVQVELPPVEMVGIEREIIVFSIVAGVGQNVTATFGKAEKDVSAIKNMITTVIHISTWQYYTW